MEVGKILPVEAAAILHASPQFVTGKNEAIANK